MRFFRYALTVIVAYSIVVTAGKAQTVRIDRQPAVAGQFYPGEKSELTRMLKSLFGKAVPPMRIQGVIAIIAPHAGYVYSGIVAASSYNQIDSGKDYENIFILGPSHYVEFEGASVYDNGDFVTPLGTVKVNTALAAQLIRKSKIFSDRTDAHAAEHSVEVQLPFLQYVMKKPFTIVPIVVGAGSPETCAGIADALRPYFNAKNLFIVSTDFSHYPSYGDANTVDKATCDAVLSNSATNVLRAIGEAERKGISNLATFMCGWPCVLTLESLTENTPNIIYTAIQYKNSGDSEVGDKSRVVGYNAIVASLQEKAEKRDFRLDEKEKEALLSFARKTLERQFELRADPVVDTSALTLNLKARCGAFVTLKKNNELRGCIGRFDPREPLYKVIQQMAIASATEDYRFPHVHPDELKAIEIEISVLTPLKRIKSIDEIELGKHGIYIRKGANAGTFLPQVATETGWTKEQFLGHCAQDKAGIGWNGWKDADIYVFEALVFAEHHAGQ